jgi:hypothetical protein
MLTTKLATTDRSCIHYGSGHGFTWTSVHCILFLHCVTDRHTDVLHETQFSTRQESCKAESLIESASLPSPSQMNTLCTLIPYYVTVHLNTILPLSSRPSNGAFFIQVFRSKFFTPNILKLVAMRVTHAANLAPFTLSGNKKPVLITMLLTV